MKKRAIIFRIDDIGASSKQFEVYSKFPGGNFLFIKYLYPFSAWGPYQELTASVLEKILKILKKLNAKLTVGVTACWVEKDNSLTPYPKKFPEQATILKNGVQEGLIEIANHGLSHCVVGQHLPRLLSSNRNFHREFWDWLPKKLHYQHLEQSQKILEQYFGKVVTFVPPGNVWTKDTEIAAAKFGLKYFCAKFDLVKTGDKSNGLTYISDLNSFSFHDRDIVQNGISWLEDQIIKFQWQGFEIQSSVGFARSLR